MDMFQDFVSIGGWNILVTICNTIITFLIVKKFLFKPVRKILAARAEEVQAMYDQAEADRAEAAAMKKDYTESIANAKAEAAQITQSATRRATVRSEEILAEASRQATDLKKKAEQSIEMERKKAMNEIKDEIADLSIMIASKVVERDINEADHKRMIEDFIDKVG